MADSRLLRPPAEPDKAPQPSSQAPDDGACRDDGTLCERCGTAQMYRMHAVWRCPACGYKTDCCGW